MGERRTVRRLLILGLWFALVVGAALWAEGRFWVSPDEWFRRAQHADDAGRSETAIALVRKGLEDAPQSPGLWGFKAYRELEVGRPDSAVQSFRRAMSAEESVSPGEAFRQFSRGRPDSAVRSLAGAKSPRGEILLGYAEALEAAGHPDSAAAVLARMDASKLSQSAQIRRAQLFGRLGSRERELEAYLTAMEEPPKDEKLIRTAVRVAASVGRWADVARLTGRLERLSADGISSSTMLRLRAQALERTDQPAEAFSIYQQIASPANLETRAGLARRLGRDSLAAALYRTLADREERKLEHVKALAVTLEESGQRAEARSVYDSLYRAGELSRGLRIRYASLLREEGAAQAAWKVLSDTPLRTDRASEARLWVGTALQAGKVGQAKSIAARTLNTESAAPTDLKLLARVHLAAGDTAQAAAMLGRYMKQRPEDWSVGVRRVGLLVESGQARTARAAAHRLLEQSAPQDLSLLLTLGHQMEQLGSPKLAREAYLRVIEESPQNPAPDLLRRLGRISYQLDRASDAVRWYEAYRSVAVSEEARRATDVPYARALLAAGRPEEAISVLQPLRERSEPEAYILAARAAESRQRWKDAAAALDKLSQERMLTTDERKWKAGLLQRGGQYEAALKSYETLLSSKEPKAHDDVVRAVGDLRLRLGDAKGAARAYRLLPDSLLMETSAGLNLARALAQSGQPDAALATYDRYLEASPPKADTIVAEAAEVALDAGRYQLAGGWTRSALADGSTSPELRLLLAESLRHQGDVRAAERHLEAVPEVAPSHIPTDQWTARIARVRGNLRRAEQAYRQSLDNALSTTDSVARLKRLTRIALERGDYGRAERWLKLIPAGEAPELYRRVERSTRPGLGYRGGIFSDANGFRQEQWFGGEMSLWPEAGIHLFGRGQGGAFRQEGINQERWMAVLGLDSIYPSSGVRLGANAGVELFPGQDDDLLVGNLRATWAVADVTRVHLRLNRTSIWSATGARAVRRFNRVTSLTALMPRVAFGLTRLSARLEHRLGGFSKLNASAGATRLDDGNHQLSVSGRGVIPFWSGPNQYLALSPNLYGQWSERDSDGLYTPSSYVSAGLGLHGIRRWGAVSLEVEMAPYLSLDELDPVGGGWGLLEAQWDLGDVRFGLGGMGLLQTDDYRAGRVYGRVEIGGNVF